MSTQTEPQFLYLSTVGWKTGKKHNIEIWFVEHGGRYYIVSEREYKAHWVQNILVKPQVSFSVGNASFQGTARIVYQEKESSLAAQISILMNEKYGWNKGVFVELVGSFNSPNT
ncbi:MAG TPA: nitroreductase family deazaflavin-dependent oxidoreductase [Nitrososphaeraceae archaeon]